MRAAVLTADRPRLALDDVPAPEPGPGVAVLDVTACGICGSDLHVASMLAPVGTVMGHEIAGTVAALGDGVDADQFPVGTPVVARPLFGCGECRFCRAGRPDHCASFALVGMDRPGGFAEQVAVLGRELFRLPARLTGAEQALVEPLAVARRALRRAGPLQGERVLVIGGGPIGLATVAWARTLGAADVVVSEPQPVRRDLARSLGADLVVDPTNDDVDAVLRDGHDDGPAVVVECTGKPGVIQQAMQHAGVDGRVVVVGVCAALDTFLPWSGLSKELDVRFALYYGRDDFVDTLDALAGGRLDAAAMITETIGLAELATRFSQLAAVPDAGKVVVCP